MDRQLWKQIEAIYQAAVDKAEDERRTYLDQACAGDTELRAEVESLLATHEQAGSFLGKPAMEEVAQEFKAQPSTDLSGRRMLHYVIREKIGEGGMGVVYRAEDSHLKRSVAIKLLPLHEMADPERKRRFIQEARAASALNHPNIITIHDISSADGIDFIVMEYVAGKPLAQLIGKRGLPLGETLKYAIQIADALEKAHRAGIIHRDLKPSNIMVTEDGIVKVLDFGLAKLTQRRQEETPGSTESLTQSGAIVGTAAYMSPEQAEGKPVDALSDIFSFGAVLYEMVTGQRAFKGDSNISTLAAVLHEEPEPISGIGGDVPQELERIIVCCLKKDPSRRFQHMDDVKVALAELKEASDFAGLQIAGVGRPKPKQRFIWMLGVAAALLVVIVIPLGWYLFRQRADALREPMRIIPFTALPGMELDPRFSPDGKFVAFSWNGPARDNRDIYVKQVGRNEEPFRLTRDPADDLFPAWSPDGRDIAFVRTSGGVTSIYTVPFPAGAERKLYELTAPSWPHAVSWSPDGRLLAFSEKSTVESPARIYLLSLDTRQKIPLTSPPAVPYGDTNPEFSPDGKRVAFVRTVTISTSDLWIQPVSSGEATRLTNVIYEAISRPAWTADGRELVFWAKFTGAGSGLFRVPFNGGLPQAIAGIGENALSPAIWRDVMVFSQWSVQPNTIWRIPGPNFRGKDRSAIPLWVSTRSDWDVNYSPDGRKLAFFSDKSGFMEVWTCDSDGTKPVQLTNLRKTSGNPRWSPDGRRIVFSGKPAEHYKVYVMDSDGGNQRCLTSGESDEDLSNWSRDGRWIYFTSNCTGIYQVWKIPSEGGEAVQITRGGGHYAQESFDGKMLYYLKPGEKWYALGPIWKVPPEGGRETPVLEKEILYWVLRPEGIYFAQKNGKKYSIDFLNFQSGKITTFFLEETPNGREFLAVSPGGEWFVYTEVGRTEADLMLVENFR